MKLSTRFMPIAWSLLATLFLAVGDTWGMPPAVQCHGQTSERSWRYCTDGSAVFWPSDVAPRCGEPKGKLGELFVLSRGHAVALYQSFDDDPCLHRLCGEVDAEQLLAGQYRLQRFSHHDVPACAGLFDGWEKWQTRGRAPSPSLYALKRRSPRGAASNGRYALFTVHRLYKHPPLPGYAASRPLGLCAELSERNQCVLDTRYPESSGFDRSMSNGKVGLLVAVEAPRPAPGPE